MIQGRATEVTISTLEGPRVLSPARHEDERGFFSETWSERRGREAGIDRAFIQDNHSASVSRGTLRGLHFQAPPHAQAKLLRVTRGAVYDVVVDLRVGSPTYGRWSGIEISEAKWNQLFVPEGFAHGFCTLAPDTHVLYKVSAGYHPASEGGIRWDDPTLAIDWPVSEADLVITDRDRAWPTLDELDSPFHLQAPSGEVPR